MVNYFTDIEGVVRTEESFIALGYVREDDNWMEHPVTKDLVQRILVWRTSNIAVDGTTTKTFKDLAKLRKHVISMGYGDGGVTDFGTARFGGVQYRIYTHRGAHWHSCPALLETSILRGVESV